MPESLGAHGDAGTPNSVSMLVYDSLLQCVLDAMRNLEIGHKAKEYGGQDDIFPCDGHAENDESLVVAAEVGSGLKALNPDDMHAFVVLSGEVDKVTIQLCFTNIF